MTKPCDEALAEDLGWALGVVFRGYVAATTAALAEVPPELVEAYYQVRFGTSPLSPERVAALETRLGELELALKP